MTDEQAEAMRASLRAGVQTVSAPSLFETPPELIERIIERAEIQIGACVLEPSAGTGKLARAALEAGAGYVLCAELNVKLCEHLERAGWIVWQGDFLDYELPFGLPVFDRVVMNPPFGNGRDALHVRHAFETLKDGGRLVAIMSPGPFFREYKSDRDFREWFAEVDGEMEELPADSFKDAGTRVSTRLVVIDK